MKDILALTTLLLASSAIAAPVANEAEKRKSPLLYTFPQPSRNKAI